MWANSCCGHPRPGERTLVAAHRRLNEELGIGSPLVFGFYARYQADLDHGMHENEFVYVYFGPLIGEPRPDPDEVSGVEHWPIPLKSTAASADSRRLSLIGCGTTWRIMPPTLRV